MCAENSCLLTANKVGEGGEMEPKSCCAVKPNPYAKISSVELQSWGIILSN